MATALTTPTLYRSLRRSLVPYERHPALLSCLSLSRSPTPSNEHYSPLLMLSAGPGQAHIARKYGEGVVTLFGEPPVYNPLRSVPRTSSVRSLMYGTHDIATRVSACLSALRLLNLASSVATEALALPDNQDIMARVPDAWKSSVRAVKEGPALTPGVLLADAPGVIAPGRALALVFDISKNVQEVHGNEKWMLRTYSVNRPFPFTVAAAMKQDNLGAFGKLLLFHGGMSDSNLSVLHTHADIEGAAPVDEHSNLCIGGSVEAINSKLDAGTARPEDFKVFMGSNAYELVEGADGELSFADEPYCNIVEGAGVVDLAMLPAAFDTEGKFRDGKGLGATDVVEGYNYARYWHQDLSWALCMHRLAESVEDGDKRKHLFSCAALHPAVALAVAQALPIDTLAVTGVVSADHPAAADLR